MNGDTTPGVSAGSNSVGACERWSAHVIGPSGAARARARAARQHTSTASVMRVRELIATSLRVEDDLQRVAGPLLQDGDRVVDAAEGELVRDERLRGEAPGGEQREGAADARAPLAALGVDGDVPAHGV